MLRRSIILASFALLLLPALVAMPTASASGHSSCGTPDEHLNTVYVDLWYSYCLGATVVWLPPEFCPYTQPLVDKPYLYVWANLCGASVILR